MLTVKQLQEKRASIGEDIRRMADRVNGEGRDFTPAERSEWDRANKDFDAISAQIDTQRREREIRGVLDGRGSRREDTPGLEDTIAPRRRGVEELQAEALQAWCRIGNGRNLKERHSRACRALGVNPRRRHFEMKLEKRSLSASTNTAGEYTIAEGFIAKLETSLLHHAAVRKVADVMYTENGAPLPWPTADDTSNTGELIAENTEVDTADPTFGVATFGAFKYSSKLVTVPNELLEDTAINLASWLGEMLGERIGRAQSPHFTTGTGSGQPQGIVTASSAGKTAASTTTFTADEVLDLIHSIDPAYRADPSFALMMSDTVLLHLRKMKDGQGKYLFDGAAIGGFTGNVANGAAGSFFGVPVYVNQQMETAFTTGKKLVLAGAFKKYKIRDVKTIRFRRLEERYAEKDQVGFLSFLRTDAKLLDAGTDPVKHLKLA